MGLFSNPEKEKRKAAEARAEAERERTKRSEEKAIHQNALNEAKKKESEEKTKQKIETDKIKQKEADRKAEIEKDKIALQKRESDNQAEIEKKALELKKKEVERISKLQDEELRQKEIQKDNEFLASLTPHQLELVLKDRKEQKEMEERQKKEMMEKQENERIQREEMEQRKREENRLREIESREEAERQRKELMELKHKQYIEKEELERKRAIEKEEIERKRALEDEERKKQIEEEKKFSNKLMKGVSLLQNVTKGNTTVENVNLSEEQKQLLRRSIEITFKMQKKSTFSQTNIEGTLNFTDEFLFFQATEKSATGFGGSSSKSLVVSINDIKSINLESKMFGMSNNLIIKSFNSELNELLSNDNSTVSLGIAKSDVDTAKEIVNKFKMV